MHNAALGWGDLKREDGMTDNNGITLISERSRNPDRDDAAVGHWVQGTSNNLTFCLEKDAD